jgi:predicted RNase H-like nuclease
MRIAGIDGCKGGWIAVLLDAPFDLGSATVVASAELRALIDRHTIDLALVDIPIGLADAAPGRSVEPKVRDFLKGRASVVFNAPCREAIGAATYPDASAINRAALNKGLSRQSWGIVPKIAETDALVRSLGQDRVREGHPEVSFALLNSASAVLSGKKTSAGREARVRLLKSAGFAPQRLLDAIPSGFGAKPDDLLDATSLVWSALRAHRSQHRSFPDMAQKDACGLEMAIWA